MLKSIRNLFFPQPPAISEVRQKSLEHARSQLEEHVQAAERHEAMIGMYIKRIERLSKSEAA